jgi:hypothetical protein
MERLEITEEMRNDCKFSVREPETKRHLGDVGLNERIILRQILMDKVWIGFSWLGILTDGGFL